MNYIPLIVTQENLSWAINENVRRIEEALATKLQTARSLPMLRIDARGNNVRWVQSEADTDACTLAKFKELQSGIQA